MTNAAANALKHILEVLARGLAIFVVAGVAMSAGCCGTRTEILETDRGKVAVIGADSVQEFLDGSYREINALIKPSSEAFLRIHPKATSARSFEHREKVLRAIILAGDLTVAEKKWLFSCIIKPGVPVAEVEELLNRYGADHETILSRWGEQHYFHLMGLGLSQPMGRQEAYGVSLEVTKTASWPHGETWSIEWMTLYPTRWRVVDSLAEWEKQFEERPLEDVPDGVREPWQDYFLSLYRRVLASKGVAERAAIAEEVHKSRIPYWEQGWLLFNLVNPAMKSMEATTVLQGFGSRGNFRRQGYLRYKCGIEIAAGPQDPDSIQSIKLVLVQRK